MPIEYEWRGEFSNDEINQLHAEAFATKLLTGDEWNWRQQVATHSLGWVVAREGDQLVGFVNLPWDGLVHAWIQDAMVAEEARHHGIGTELMKRAEERAREAGCEYLHVDFDDELKAFYWDACGFTPTNAGIIKF